MRERILKQLAKLHSDHPGRMAVLVIILSILLGLLASRLHVTMRWSDLLPDGDKRTLEFNKIVDEFRTATSIIVVVQGEEDRIKQFADSLAPRLSKAVLTEEGESPQHLIQRVDYKIEIDFIRNHGFLLMKEDDLKNMKLVVRDPHLPGLLMHINDNMEQEYVGKSESISNREKEDQAVMFLDGIQNTLFSFIDAAQHGIIDEARVFQTSDKLLQGEPYFLSYDKSTLILNAIPTFSVTDVGLLIDGT